MIPFLRGLFLLFFLPPNKNQVSIERNCASLSSCLFFVVFYCRLWKHILWHYIEDISWLRFFSQLIVILDSEQTIVRREGLLKYRLSKNFEPTSKTYLIFWVVPQTPLFFFDSWDINLVRTAEITENSLACAERKKKFSHWKQNYYGCGTTLFWKSSRNLEEET